MSKEMEKLIEEIGEVVAESIGALLAPSTDEEYSRVKREISNRLIARIGKAYADGMKLPGQQGRRKAGLGEFSPMVTWAHRIWKEGLLTTEHETTIFIALRKKEPE